MWKLLQTPQRGGIMVRNNCPGCRRKMTTESFIRKALKVHGDRYIYDETVLVNGNEHVKIRCRIHGIFEQVPYKHIAGRGCWECLG